jgi:hypothetical protein
MFERDSEKARRVVFARYQASEARFRREAIHSESRTPGGPRPAGQPKAASGGRARGAAQNEGIALISASMRRS